MTFDEALERRRKHNFGLMHGDQDFRHGWNFALEAILDVIDEVIEKTRDDDQIAAVVTRIGEMGVEVQT
jgi:hypothetical protein